MDEFDEPQSVDDIVVGENRPIHLVENAYLDGPCHRLASYGFGFEAIKHAPLSAPHPCLGEPCQLRPLLWYLEHRTTRIKEDVHTPLRRGSTL